MYRVKKCLIYFNNDSSGISQTNWLALYLTYKDRKLRRPIFREISNFCSDLYLWGKFPDYQVFI